MCVDASETSWPRLGGAGSGTVCGTAAGAGGGLAVTFEPFVAESGYRRIIPLPATVSSRTAAARGALLCHLVAADPLAPLLDLPGVAAGVDRARDAVDALLGNRVLRRRSPDVSAESALRGAWASAWLAGREAPLAEVRSGAAADDPVVQGALRAQSAIGTLTDVWTRAPRQALARLHALAAADLVTAEELGRPAPGTPQRLDTLAEVLAATSAPAPVVAAIVHGELLGLDAFAPVSGVVALAAVRLTLVERGLDPKSLVVVEVGHREAGSDYLAALEAYRNGIPDGIARWLVHCADAIVGGAREAQAICESMARMR
jgi:hypothetical protein